jgi:Nickel-dependent hydrogenase
MGKLPSMQTTKPWDTLSGQYQLQPGTSPGIVGQRPVLGAGRLGRLLQGQRGEQVGRTLSSVFTLCAHAHRRCAELALAVAQPAQAVPERPAPVLLYLETARDHLRSIALDWPQRLSEPEKAAQRMDWLRGCPLPLAPARPVTDVDVAWQTLRALRNWLETAVLKQDALSWLQDCSEPDALLRWCEKQDAALWPARCLSAWHPLTQTLRPLLRVLDVLSDDAMRQEEGLRQLGHALAQDADFAQHPTWLGHAAETGAWTRLRHRQQQTEHNAWTRMSARWLELVELAAADVEVAGQGRATLLASGALHLGTGQALAWCEMARGLLLHWVRLDVAGAVQDYRVLAPTEWNFHPEGALAQAVAALPCDAVSTARTLAAAYDPCVPCTV